MNESVSLRFFFLKKKKGDIVLVGLRDFQDDKGDVILKYNADEARTLKAYGELPESAKINETTGEGIIFGFVRFFVWFCILI